MAIAVIRRWVEDNGDMIMEYYDSDTNTVYTKKCDCVDLRS